VKEGVEDFAIKRGGRSRVLKVEKSIEEGGSKR